MKNEKLQKILAASGLGSRRKMEEWITAQRVSVNGKIANLGERASLEDIIRVDGHILRHSPKQALKTQVLLYHKPAGEMCTRSDPEGRATVFDNLPSLHKARWIAVGRLDYHTSGLLIFTNNGELANYLMHPKASIEREYAVRILGEVDQVMLNQLREGVVLEDGLAKFKQIKHAGGTGANQWYHVILEEGRNREVRRLWESQNVTVSRLIRIRYGSICLPPYLKSGKWEKMQEADIKNLLQTMRKKPEKETNKKQ